MSATTNIPKLPFRTRQKVTRQGFGQGKTGGKALRLTVLERAPRGQWSGNRHGHFTGQRLFIRFPQCHRSLGSTKHELHGDQCRVGSRQRSLIVTFRIKQ